MNIRINGNDILHEGFKGVVPIARFTDDGLTERAKRQFIHEHNCGVEMLEIFEQRGHGHAIKDIMAMIDEMRRAFAVYRNSGYTRREGE